jgi:hypothetical protein
MFALGFALRCDRNGIDFECICDGILYESEMDGGEKKKKKKKKKKQKK